MIQKTRQGIYQSTLLSDMGVTHGYSHRHIGDTRVQENRERFFNQMGMTSADVVYPQQVHGIDVYHVYDIDAGSEIPGVDGLVHKKESKIPYALAVEFADCTPLLAIDPHANVIGVAHAGWRGTLAGIAKELISSMREKGADPKKIVVSIGPHIGMCCYDVHEDRAAEFQKIFGNNPKITSRVGEAWHLDIGYASYQMLLDSGVRPEYIDAPPVCTSCQVSEYFSFRADSQKTFGEQIGIIGFTS